MIELKHLLKGLLILVLGENMKKLLKSINEILESEAGVNVNMELDKNVNVGIGQFCTNSFFVR